MAEPLVHITHGRNLRTLGALAVALVILAYLYSIGTVTWVLVVMGLFVIPAVFDVLRNPQARFELTDTMIEWQSTTQHAQVPLSRLQKARFDTRLDMSVRVTFTLIDQSKMRIPQDTLPPHRILEAALKDHGIKTERHHFRVL